MKSFDTTPSFYNNEETFSKYLKYTSYYIALQNCLLKIVEKINPKNIVELGSATGESVFFLAKSNINSNFIGYDFRENIVKEANKNNKHNNVSFYCLDMLEFAKSPIEADFIFMLYSFHHIEDPLKNKIDFLANLYKNLKTGSFVCILETFIPDKIKLKDKNEIINFWKKRSEEGYSTVFWNIFHNYNFLSEDIEKAKNIAKYCKKNEYQAGLLVADRDEEYCVHRNWVKEQAKKIGFKVILNEPVNGLGEGVILLQK